MSAVAELFIGIAMAIGIAGTLFPILPGILLTWFAGFIWTVADGGGLTRWLLFALMSALMVFGLISHYRIPARDLKGMQAPKWTMLYATIGGVIGFFAIPIIGLIVGFAGGVLIRYFIDTNDWHRAFSATVITVKSLIRVAVVQFLCATGITFLWFIDLLLT